MSSQLPVLSPKELIKALEKAGFSVHRQKGSHIFLKKLEPEVRITLVPYHVKDIKKGTLKSILKQADLTVDELKTYL